MDAELVSGHLLPPGSVFAFLAEHGRELSPGAMFADLRSLRETGGFRPRLHPGP